MSYSVSFLLQAQADLIESIHWYNGESDNLGFEFHEVVNDKLKKISENPLQYSKRFKNLRAIRTDRFPYLIYFNSN